MDIDSNTEEQSQIRQNDISENIDSCNNTIEDNNKVKCYSKLIENFRERFSSNLYRVNEEVEYLFLESKSDVKGLTSFTRKLTVDTFCRKILQFPGFIRKHPNFKLILKRFQIYDLIVRNLPMQAKSLFTSSFKNLFHLNNFIPILMHFNLIFSFFEISQKILIENFISMRNALIDEVDKIYYSIFEKNERVIFKKEEGFYLGPCLENEITNFDFLQCECLVFSLVLEEIKKIKHDFCYFNLFNKEIQNIQEDFYNKYDFFADFENGTNMKSDDNNEITECSNVVVRNSNLSIKEEDFNSNDFSYGSLGKRILDEDVLERIRDCGILEYTNFYNSKANNFCDSKNTNSLTSYIPQESLNIYNAMLKQKYYDISLEDILGIQDKPVINESICKVFIIGQKTKALYLYSSKTKISLNFLFSQNILSLPNSFSEYEKLSEMTRSRCTENTRISSDNEKKVKYREANSFLKTFSPKFMKRESLDKIILRRFKKFVIVFLKEKEILFGKCLKIKGNNFTNTSIGSNISNYSSIDDINNNASITSITSINSIDSIINDINSSDSNPLSFIIEFAVNNYLPPCKIIINHKNNNINSKTLAFKSFSSQYLLWLFSDPVVRIVYDEFVKEFSQQIIDMLITNYDLNNIENCIINKLSYYIHNLNTIYHDESNIDQNNNHSKTSSNNIKSSNTSNVCDFNNIISKFDSSTNKTIGNSYYYKSSNLLEKVNNSYYKNNSIDSIINFDRNLNMSNNINNNINNINNIEKNNKNISYTQELQELNNKEMPYDKNELSNSSMNANNINNINYINNNVVPNNESSRSINTTDDLTKLMFNNNENNVSLNGNSLDNISIFNLNNYKIHSNSKNNSNESIFNLKRDVNRRGSFNIYELMNSNNDLFDDASDISMSGKQ